MLRKLNLNNYFIVYQGDLLFLKNTLYAKFNTNGNIRIAYKQRMFD